MGWDAEVEQLRKALEKAREGHGPIVAIVGEPGVGKSRPFSEFTHSHRTQGWLILESGSVSDGKATVYLPVIDLRKAYFQIGDRDDARKIQEKVVGKLADPRLGVGAHTSRLSRAPGRSGDDVSIGVLGARSVKYA